MKFHPREDWVNNYPKDKWSHDCPFCNKTQWKDEYIIWEWTYWLVIHNKFPILGLDTHIMAVPKKHTILAHEISSRAMGEYPEVLEFIHNFYNWAPYFSFMRESLESRSLEHLHYHFISGKIWYEDIEYFLKKQGF